MALGTSTFRASEPALIPAKPISRGSIILGSASRLSNRRDLLETLALPPNADLTDGELIFEVYRRYRSECVHLLRGLWSFAAWDGEQKRFFLARDATGTSPLYWWHHRQRLVFASSMKALRAYPGFLPEPDIRAVACNLAWRVGPDGGDTTAYKNVRQLLPGRQLDLHDDSARVTRWWRPENLSTLHLPNDEDYYEAFTEVYRESVRNCVAERAGAIAVSLSSGLDSSSVLAVAAPLVKAAGGRLLALTHAPKYELDGTPATRLGDEFPAASAVAQLAGNVDHFAVRSDVTTILQGVRESLDLLDYPTGGAHHFYWLMDLFRRAAQEGVHTFLHGQGGNGTVSFDGGRSLWPELRAGRMKLVFSSLLADRGGWVTGVKRRLVAPLIIRPVPREQSAEQEFRRIPFTAKAVADLELRKMKGQLAERTLSGVFLTSAVRLGLRDGVVPGEHLAQGGASYGMEVFDPTRDQRVVEFCWRIPERIFWKNGLRRALIRHTLRDRLPAEVLFPARKGYQSADFGKRVLAEKKELLEAVEALQQDSLAKEWLDIPRMRESLLALEANISYPNVRSVQQVLVRGLAMGEFLQRF
jgi:asparagine synthase (glutamine-hydrolysing)